MVAVFCAAGAQAAEPVRPVPEAEAQAWIRHLLPLPKEVRIAGKVTVPAKRVRVVTVGGAAALAQASARELAALLDEKAGAAYLTGAGGAGDFLFSLRLSPADPDLAKRPNASQAYRIRPLLAGSRLRGLECVATTEEGLHFAVQTLKQLLAPGIQGKGAEATVSVPAVTIMDWPDLEERGEWGGTALPDLEWMSERKFNLIELHAELSVDDQRVGHAKMKPELMARAAEHGVRIVPIIHHLEQLDNTGIFKAFPQIKAVGVENSICFSRPEVVTLVGQWLTELGQTAGVSDVMIWLSEEGKGCKCEGCAKDDRFVNETRACLAAWEAAKKVCPRLGLRLLLTQASYPSNDKILAAVPEGVKVSYYHGGLTYDTTRRPMIYPLLEEYTKKGRWLGVYPTLGACWLIAGPFSNPEFVHYRMTEFVDDGLRCLVGYAVPANWLYPVNVEAAMEWSWNAHGRSPHEFAAAYAVRHGMKDPEKFAAWTEALGPVSWDVYGSRFPFHENWGGGFAHRVAAGTAKTEMGKTIFTEFKNEAQLDADLVRCETALALANDLGDEALIVETRIIQGYVRVLKSVWELGKVVHGDQGVKAEEREVARHNFELFNQACNAITALYPRWFDVCAAQTPGTPPQRFTDTITLMEILSSRMGTLMERCGFEDTEKPYRTHVIGEWKSEEFAEKRSQVRRLDVTEFVRGAGTYLFRPKYKSGSLGLGASRVALVSHPKDRPEDTREEAVDAHDCHAGAWVKGDEYRLELKEHDPARGYAVLAHISGGSTTNGQFHFRKVRPE